MELSTYLDQAMSNLLKMSRTACGVVDVSASTNKKDYMAIESGKEAERYAQANFREAIRMCYDHRKDSYETPQELRTFLESVAVRINRGIVRDGVFFRIENSEKYSYVRAEEIPEEVDWFFRKLYGRLKADPVETAAFCEFCINLTGHYLADGCGKFSMAVAAFVLMRADMTLPVYRTRKEYFAWSPAQPCSAESDMRRQALQRFTAYYRTLF